MYLSSKVFGRRSRISGNWMQLFANSPYRGRPTIRFRMCESHLSVAYNSGLNLWNSSHLSALSVIYDKVLLSHLDGDWWRES